MHHPHIRMPGIYKCVSGSGASETVTHRIIDGVHDFRLRTGQEVLRLDEKTFCHPHSHETYTVVQFIPAR